MRILVVEDDMRISAPLREELESQHYIVDLAGDGEEAWHFHKNEVYDLILLDLNIPKIDGLTLCQKIRQAGFAGGILMLTARGDKFDKVSGLDSGADDYVVKPFDMDELGARIRALLRRGTAAPASESDLSHGKLKVDLRSCTVSFQDKKVDLTPTEYRLLITFLRNPGKTFNRAELIERLWHFDEAPTESVVKSHIKGLRSKLTAAGCKTDVIETVFGFGYKLACSID